ncbi:MAG TPA: hypothetical protein DHW64_11700 [Chitinophagaceae bacterium]|nr:hypothetical protein [Chitinophagaceae bacterium]
MVPPVQPAALVGVAVTTIVFEAQLFPVGGGLVEGVSPPLLQATITIPAVAIDSITTADLRICFID